jgi:hypothetical protein
LKRIARWLAGQKARSWMAGLILIAVGGSLAGQWQQQQDWQARFVAQQHAQQAQAAREAAAQKANQEKQSLAICSALVGLDGASKGVTFEPETVSGIPLSRSYGYQLARHIHDVVQATHCAQLLAGKEKP